MKHVHFIGIAGSGTSACAAIAKAQGFEISGCDKNPTQEFAKNLAGVKIQSGHSKTHLEGVDILALTPAILSLDPNNEEILEAKKRKIKVMTWQEFLGKFLTKDHFVVAVCGTHGKSTTTAMIGKILEDSKLDPTVILGANVTSWDKNYRLPTNVIVKQDQRSVILGSEATPESAESSDSGHGSEGLTTSARMTNKKTSIFVVEADEYFDNFLSIFPEITVVTNIEMDHPEYFKDFVSYKRAFQNFLHQAKKVILANLEDPGTKETLTEEGASSGGFFKPITDYSKTLIDFPLKLIGQHNILNASAALQAGLSLGLDPKVIQNSLANFTGIARRQEYLGEINGAKIYSDFGHHPTEIKATINAFRQNFRDREIFVVFEPHMFTRTKALFEDFVKTFRNLDVDGAIIVDIYKSREEDPGDINSKMLVEAISKKNIEYVPTVKEVFAMIKPTLTKNDLVLFMGAGEIDAEVRKLI